ncbi:MAG: stage 0 sporulation protein J, partial [Oscillospiraceae bacterium]|nr:stage 0 sporulation protein J [Oscillospiraceae bacterium]
VRQTEALCKKLAQPPKPERQSEEPTVDYYAECARSLSRTLGRKAKIVSGRRKGRVELEYYGLEDLQILLDALESLGGK